MKSATWGASRWTKSACYVFAVKPKKLESGQRYFEGQVWVDDRDLQIVKSYGRGVGLLKRGADNQYPKFETYREQIDGKYWFPTYTIANDTLQFQTGPQKIKMMVKYEDYKQFKSDINIKYGDEVKDDTKQSRAEEAVIGGLLRPARRCLSDSGSLRRNRARSPRRIRPESGSRCR